MLKNYYQILGLEPSASKQDIKRAYRVYATKFHPDKQSGDKFFEERFKDIKEAYDVLHDDNKRLNYDNQINTSESSSNWTPNYQYEEELKQREEKITKREAEQEKENTEQQKIERLQKEKELRSRIFYKNKTFEINGINIIFLDNSNDNIRLNIFDYDSVDFIREKQKRTKVGTLLIVSFWFTFIGLVTVAFYVGIIFLIVGLMLFIVAIFKGSFKVFKEISASGEYRIKLRGTYNEFDILMKGRKRKIKRIAKAIRKSIENYYAT